MLCILTSQRVLCMPFAGRNNLFLHKKCYFCALLSLFSISMEKDEKTCFNADTNDFDQRMARRAPVCWSKYTTRRVPFDNCREKPVSKTQTPLQPKY